MKLANLKIVHAGCFLANHFGHVVDEAQVERVFHVDLVFGRELHAVGVMVRELEPIQ
jgi:hypothetical protein